jgi:hypothetical protein
MGDMRNSYSVSIERHKGKKDLAVDGRILKWIVKKQGGLCGLDCIGSG